MAKPKLALIPSAQGDKFYSVLPSSGVGDFDFTRSGGATRINSQGLIETVADGVSRLNYPLIDGKVVGCPSHLLESARTNLFTYSEDFSASIWGLSGSATREANAAISPNGTLDAYKITSNGGNLAYGQGGVVSENTTNQISFFAKKGTDNIIQITESFYFGSSTIFDLESGSITSGNGTIESYPNDWYRCSVSYTYGAGQTILSFNLKNTGLGYFYLFGFQGEQGSFATSYIPSLIGSQTTRSAETANNSGDASTFNDSEGVLMAEISAFNNIGSFENLSLSNGTSASRLIIFYRNTLNVVEFRVTVNNVIQMQFQYTIEDTKTFNKMLIKYKQNDFEVWVNGFEIHTDNSGITFNSYPLNNLSFDNGQVSAPSSPFYGNTKQIQYYDSADIDLETLTSWVSFSDMAEGQLYTIE